MTINVRIRDGMCPDPTTGDGGATEGDIRGSFSDIIDVVGVKDLACGHALVTQNSPAAMSVLVAPGVVYIPNADYDELDSNQVKFWEAVITVSTAVAITANTSGSTRIDLICVKMDTAVTPDEHASNIATLVAVAGTPGAGVPTTPDNYAKLAEIEVANGAATIVNADITDSRVQADINGAYVKKSNGLTFTEISEPDTPAANKVIVYAKDVSGVSKLFFKQDDGTEVEIGAGGGSTELVAEPTNDLTGNGITIQLVAKVNLAFGDVCYIASDGKLALIDADAIASMSGLFMCIDETISADATGNFLVHGIARNDAWAWTVGGLIYGTVTGTTGNTLSQTAPTGIDDVVQIIGVATHADRILFNPQLVQVEHT